MAVASRPQLTPPFRWGAWCASITGGIRPSCLDATETVRPLSIRIVRSAIDRGITFMERFWNYDGGPSELRMGKALSGDYQDKLFLMIKIDGRSKREAARQLDESLRPLQPTVSTWSSITRFSATKIPSASSTRRTPTRRSSRGQAGLPSDLRYPSRHSRCAVVTEPWCSPNRYRCTLVPEGSRYRVARRPHIERLGPTSTSERVEDGKVQHETSENPAAGATNSRKWLQVAGIDAVTAAPLDQESPGSSPGGAMKPGDDLHLAGLR